MVGSEEFVKANPICKKTVDDLKKGPVKVPNVIATGESAGTKYTDTTF